MDFCCDFLSLTKLLERRINFSDVTSEELEYLASTCDPATFGVKNEDVFDESYRKAGKLDSENFALSLDIRDVRAGKSKKIDIIDAIYYGLLRGNEIWKQGKYSNGEHIKKEVVPELYKLNVYGKLFISVFPLSRNADED